MTQEEKARAYDEALEKARKLYNDAKANEYKSDMEDYEFIFPELRESEDEKIRKAIIGIIKNSNIIDINVSHERMLAYLEKQAEEKFDLIDRNFRRGREVGYREGVADTIAKQKDLDKMIVISPEVWDNAITDAYENGKRDSEKQKEQKPAESISQLTVQGKGVYKICPRCKERMVRDDSMVYTSMPPQYRYECPKCGESECDTVMYDNPEMEEQKPAELAMQQLKGE